MKNCIEANAVSYMLLLVFIIGVVSGGLIGYIYGLSAECAPPKVGDVKLIYPNGSVHVIAQERVGR